MTENTLRRFARILDDGLARWAEVDSTGVVVGVAPGDALPDVSKGLRPVQGGKPPSFLTPFCGRNVVGLAYNYKGLVGGGEHHEEPLLFLKGAHSASVVGGDAVGVGRVPLPAWAEATWAEVELAVVIGRPCFEVSSEEVASRVLGYCVASDLTTTNVHGRDHHLARSKALPGFAPLSPLVVHGVDPRDLAIETRVDGKQTQSSRTSDMICDPFEAVSLASRVVPLEPGDVVLTGTPAGAMESRVRAGSMVEHRIEGVGRLAFEVVPAGRARWDDASGLGAGESGRVVDAGAFRSLGG